VRSFSKRFRPVSAASSRFLPDSGGGFVAWVGDDAHGSGPRPRLLQRATFSTGRPEQDIPRTVLHPGRHARLRPGVFSAGRYRRLSVGGPRKVLAANVSFLLDTRFFLSPQIPIQRSVLHSFGQMFDRNPLATSQIGYRSSYLKDTIISASAQIQRTRSLLD
jgi:hypothetical protein